MCWGIWSASDNARWLSGILRRSSLQLDRRLGVWAFRFGEMQDVSCIYGVRKQVCVLAEAKVLEK